MRIFITLLSCSLTLFLNTISYGQGNASVRWQFASELKPNHECILIMVAHVAPGWHLYSQFMEDGGPMPTHFTFLQSKDFLVMGKTEEKGNAVSFLDEIYDMKITWYSEQVSFLQRIRLIQPDATVKGEIEYMVCNDHSCVPGKQEFSIPVGPLKKAP